MKGVIMVQPNEIVPFLRQVEMFRYVAPDALGAILSRTSEKVFDSGEVLFHEGDPGDRLYVLLRGKVRVYVERQGTTLTYNVLEAGTCFGEMALVEDALRSASVRAEEPCRCVMLEKQDFLELLQEHPHIALTIIRDLCQRLRYTNTRVQEYVKQLAALSPSPG